MTRTRCGGFFFATYPFASFIVRILPRSFFDRDTEGVARDLLGQLLIHQTPTGERIGRIVEVEAYVGAHDLASHSSRGITPRTRVMYGEPGHAYVYLIYGLHHCMNVVTEAPGKGCAVLLRALEPVAGIQARCTGPGLLSRAMDIGRDCNGLDLCGSSPLFLAEGHPTNEIVLASPRIGVDYAGEWAKAPLRFHYANPRPRAQNVPTRK